MNDLFWLVLILGILILWSLQSIRGVLIYISRQLRDWELPVIKTTYARNDPKDPHNLGK